VPAAPKFSYGQWISLLALAAVLTKPIALAGVISNQLQNERITRVSLSASQPDKTNNRVVSAASSEMGFLPFWDFLLGIIHPA
jgi:hypothetical protein